MTIINKKYHLNSIAFWVSFICCIIGIMLFDHLEGLFILIVFLFSHWSWTLGNRPESSKKDSQFHGNVTK